MSTPQLSQKPVVFTSKSKTLDLLKSSFSNLSDIADKPYLEHYDSICVVCEKSSHNSRVLKGRVEELSNHKEEFESTQRVRDFLNELDGYQWLNEQGYKNIRFLEEDNKEERPDLVFNKFGDSPDVYAEVKTIRLSEDEERIFLSGSGPSQTLSGNVNWRRGLKKKTREHVEKAKSQFEAVGSKDGLLLLFYQLGLDSIVHPQPERYITTLDKALGKKFFKDLEKEYNLEIIRLHSK